MQKTTSNSANPLGFEQKTLSFLSFFNKKREANAQLLQADLDLSGPILLQEAHENLKDTSIHKLKLGPLSIDKFIQSMTHKSWPNEHPHWSFGNNEKLEFIGDAVLDLWCSEKLWRLFPEYNEGELSRFRSAIVNEETLGEWARVLGLQDFLLMGKGEYENQLQFENGPLADAFESLLGGLFLDLGLSESSRILNHWSDLYDKSHELRLFSKERLNMVDPKGKLQELTTALYQDLPEYKSQESGSGFEVSLWLKGEKLASLKGISKKKIEKALAKKVLIEKLYQ